MARKPADQSVDREDILWAAAEVLHRNGYDATTMKDIAAQVNLTAASLYHHFKNKDFLLLNVLEVGLDLTIDKLEAIDASDLSCTEKLGEMIRSHVVSVTGNVAGGAAMVFEIRALLNVNVSAKNGDQSFNQDFVQRRNRFFARRDYFESLFGNVVRAGIAAGEFRQVDAAIVTKAMLGAQLGGRVVPRWRTAERRGSRGCDGGYLAGGVASLIIGIHERHHNARNPDHRREPRHRL